MSNSNLIDLYRKLRPLQILFNDRNVKMAVKLNIKSDCNNSSQDLTSNSSQDLANNSSKDLANESSQGLINENSKDIESVIVLTYNLLSQHHINSEAYPYCKPGILRSSYRTVRLISELSAYMPFNLAAFQEVSQFDGIWRKEFEKMDFKCFYAEKAGGRDGICLIFDPKMFQSLHEEIISFSPLMSALEAIPNVAQILVLKSNSDKLFIVSNTHLYWKPDFDCLRVLQAHRLRKRIEEVKSNFLSQDHNDITLFMCGDWNSDPKSAVYYLISGLIDRISRSHWQDLINSHSNLLKHPLESSQRLFSQVLDDFKKWSPLTSAYSLYKSSSDPSIQSEPLYTSINAYVDTLDYIFTDFKNVHVAELLMLPSDEIVRGQTALPNEIYSSDHLALMAKFNLQN